MDIFEEIIRLRRAGGRAALATIVHTNGSIPSYESSRMLVREDGSILGTVGGGCVEAEVWAAAKEVIQAEAPRKMTFNLNHEANYDNGLICGGTLEIFVEPILPQPTLYIFGGGHVSMALANAAQTAGFAIGVVDDREAFANAQRFPMAREIYTTYEDAFEKLQPNASSYLVIVTRGHKDDMRVLRWAVSTEARYIGMIGSKRKVLSVYKALEQEGISAEKLEHVHAPVGLEIGALTPEEIAISIAAEYTPATGAQALNMTFDFGQTTQFGSAFNVNAVTQDGFTTGRLIGIDIDSTGIVQARFTNGRSLPLGQVALANFANPQGMQQLGDTNWAETFGSGQALRGQAGNSGFGLIQSGALEASNVDITEQLVNMITAQRNFQANAQMISTADAITQSIINIR